MPAVSEVEQESNEPDDGKQSGSVDPRPYRRGSGSVDRPRALEILDRQLMAQASVIAYSRIYVLSAVLILALIPLLLLVRHTKSAGGAQPVME